MFVVLGIDPGVSRCGYAAIERTRTRSKPLAIGVIRTDPGLELPIRLLELQEELRLLNADFTPTVVAIERVLFSANVRTAMSVGQASGLAMTEGARGGAQVVEYSPNQIKQVVTGDGRATKAQVQTMVQSLLRLSAPPQPADAADAAAVALCHLAFAPGAGRGVAAATVPSTTVPSTTVPSTAASAGQAGS